MVLSSRSFPLRALLATLASTTCFIWSIAAQPAGSAVRLNQVGFYPDGPKVAVATGAPAGAVFVLTADGRDTVWTGELSAERTNPYSGKQTRLADFSGLRQTGSFVVVVPGMGQSFPFEIKPAVHHAVGRAALKGFYLIRAGMALSEAYAGPWARPAGHPDTQVLVHPSATSEGRPAGTVIRSPGGWYDAGDYNKYIVNSGITMGTLLSLYEDFPRYCDTLKVGIPEGNNALPDLLDEALWNLRWMLTMQDPADGGVYHKLTNPEFEGMIMPHAARKPRYVVQKSTAAALDFAAVMAQAARVYERFDRQLPGLADSCRTAAVRAWQWAKANPAMIYRQEEMNKQFDPDVVTGPYGGDDVSDEWQWAAAELYISTGDKSYYRNITMPTTADLPLPSWGQVRLLGYYTLARHAKQVPRADRKDLQKHLAGFGDSLLQNMQTYAYATPMGRSARDFVWGSSAVAANQGIALLQAYRLTKDKRYLHGALANLDYLLGRNATGYSFVTGYGDRRVMHPHHRPSEADGVDEPVPGLLSGGPNPGRQDKCPGYPSTAADEAFIDDVCSYASNEIAINWNAPLVYLALAVEAIMQK